MTKICLCMIVKNESQIMERCLDDAKPIIDYISICDTGSGSGSICDSGSICGDGGIGDPSDSWWTG